MTWELHLGDCIEGMRGLPDKSVDHVIADPPYSEHVHGNVRSNAGSPHAKSVPLRFKALTEAERAVLAMQYARIVRRWVLIFCEAEGLGAWKNELEQAGLEWVRAGFWVRPDSMPQVSADRPAAGAEIIVIAHAVGAKKRWNCGGKRGVWTANLPRGDDRYGHETPKPVDLLRQLVSDFTDPSELILDSHAGSGTTGAACLELGRRFLGWELDPKHYATASKRLTEASKQQPLFRVATTQEQERLPL